MQRYIDLGWYTVPLGGELRRLEDGSKTIPVFEKDWRDKYSATFNTRITAIGGALTGEKSGIIAIDCDNTETWQLFRSLDPDYGFTFYSVGKGDSVCGTLIYSYTPEVADSFNVRNNLLSLDVYSNNGFIYLATEANSTKLPPESLTLKPVPMAIVTLLKQLQLQKDAKVERALSSQAYTSFLAPLVEQFVGSKKYNKGLFKVLTPRDFRDLEQYQREGHLHPENIPDGRGSEYLSKVSAILGADKSIDKELYVHAMSEINSLFTDPMPIRRLEQTITDPMLEEKAAVDGNPIWQYDKDWEAHKVLVTTKRSSALEVVYDDARLCYYVLDMANEDVKNFPKDADLMQYLDAVGRNVPKKADLKRAVPLVNMHSIPSQPFGFIDTENFNSFIPTPALRVLHNPLDFADKYVRPETTLRYLETLVPDSAMRNYLLRFLRHKLLTFEYSPVILYFIGAHGSGKDTLVNILEKIVGRVSRPTVKEFLEPFNGYMLDSYFVQLDEYGNQLQRSSDKDEALGKIKAYSGKSTISIRAMRTDGYSYNHSVTFISTANKNPLILEDGDRRVALFETPNVLAQADWVRSRGGIGNVIDIIMSEVVDFAYYLATEVDSCVGSEYVVPPETEAKHTLIANSMGIAARLAYACKHGQTDLLLELAEDNGVASAIEELNQYYITSVSLQAIYDNATNFEGDSKAVLRACRQINVPMMRTTINNSHAFKVAMPRNSFVPVEGEFTDEIL